MSGSPNASLQLRKNERKLFVRTVAGLLGVHVGALGVTTWTWYVVGADSPV